MLASLAFSNAAHAATFTLAELSAGQEFTIGSLRFFDWNFDNVGSTVDPTLVTIETVDSNSLPGFVLNGNAELTGPLASLDYQYKVETTDALVIRGALLWLTESFASPEASIAVTLQDPVPSSLTLSVGVSEGIEDLSDAAVLGIPRSELSLRSVVEMDLAGETGAVLVRSYATQFTVVPEPTTAVLLGAALAGLALLRRREV